MQTEQKVIQTSGEPDFSQALKSRMYKGSEVYHPETQEKKEEDTSLEE